MLGARNTSAAAASCSRQATPSFVPSRPLAATQCSMPSCSTATAPLSTRATSQHRHAAAGCGLRGAPGSRRRLGVLCMAHPRRVAKVAAAIQRELGVMLVSDQVVTNALSPERKLGEDRQLSVVPSITHVYVSNDLQVVKVYISIYSDDYGKKRAMSNLKRLEPYVRREMGQRVPLRLTPEYRFEYDDTLDEMELVQKVIGEADVARYKKELAEEFGEDKEEEETVVPKGEGSGRKAKQGKRQLDDDKGFFQNYREYSSKDVFTRKGPFDDLFSGEGDDLVQSVSKAKVPEQPKGGKGKRQQE